MVHVNDLTPARDSPAQGKSCSRIHRTISKCPCLAAVAQLSASIKQRSAPSTSTLGAFPCRSHWRISRCPPSAAWTAAQDVTVRVAFGSKVFCKQFFTLRLIKDCNRHVCFLQSHEGYPNATSVRCTTPPRQPARARFWRDPLQAREVSVCGCGVAHFAPRHFAGLAPVGRRPLHHREVPSRRGVVEEVRPPRCSAAGCI
jgi:hypothetical protein